MEELSHTTLGKIGNGEAHAFMFQCIHIIGPTALVMFPYPNLCGIALPASQLLSAFSPRLFSLAALNDLMSHWRLGAIPIAKATTYAFPSQIHPFMYAKYAVTVPFLAIDLVCL